MSPICRNTRDDGELTAKNRKLMQIAEAYGRRLEKWKFPKCCDQEWHQTLSLLRLHEGSEARLEKLQIEVGAGRRDREVRSRQDTPRWPRRGDGRRSCGTSQDSI